MPDNHQDIQADNHQVGSRRHVRRKSLGTIGGTSRAYIIARLARDAGNGDEKAAELFRDVEAGRCSANMAAEMMGWRTYRDRYHRMCAEWDNANAEERERF